MSLTPSRLFACRLCWRITFAVFALILLVEAALLVPSALRFRDTEFHRLATIAETAVQSLLALGTSDPSRLATGFNALIGRMHVAGLAAFRLDGSLVLAAGEPVGAASLPRPAALGERPQPVRYEGNRYEIAWRASAGGVPLLVVARMDSGDVTADLIAYALHVSGLVAIIVLVVTSGTMVVLHYAVLRPVLRLRKSMMQAGAQPDSADRFAVRSRRRDEIGELIVAHNAMLARVAEAKRRDIRMAEERARRDALTALPNRFALVEYLEQQRVEDTKRHYCTTLLLIDVIEFRFVNAEFGTAVGDTVLKSIATRLNLAAGPQDFVAHLGADRFAVARLGALAGTGAAAMAERILRDVGGTLLVGGTRIPVRLHIGIAHLEGECVEAQTILGQADLALTRARAEGRGGYQFFADSMTEEAKTRQRLTRDLELALQTGALFLTFQPKVSIHGSTERALAGAEALVRWKHPTEGFIRPDIFIPIAESTGLIAPLGEWVLRRACLQVREWLDRFGWSPRIAVNLSARQFAESGLKTQIERLLQESRISAQFLELEITERAAMSDAQTSAATLRELRSLGLRVSIDDFGTGYSSLSYLRRFEVDAIKIDKTFVDEIGVDSHGEAICDAVLRIGQALNVKVIAEGVEKESQLGFLRRRRCDEAQGYLFSKPLPAAEFEQTWLAARAAA